MIHTPGPQRRVRVLVRRIAVGAVHDLRRASPILLVGAIVAFMPLLWQIVDDEIAPMVVTPGAAVASDTSDEWIVVSRDEIAVRTAAGTVFFEACITYTSPGGTQERCQITGFQGQSDSPWHDEAEQCWDKSRIGDPLPDCWR